MHQAITPLRKFRDVKDRLSRSNREKSVQSSLAVGGSLALALLDGDADHRLLERLIQCEY